MAGVEDAPRGMDSIEKYQFNDVHGRLWMEKRQSMAEEEVALLKDLVPQNDQVILCLKNLLAKLELYAADYQQISGLEEHIGNTKKMLEFYIGEKAEILRMIADTEARFGPDSGGLTRDGLASPGVTSQLDLSLRL